MGAEIECVNVSTKKAQSTLNLVMDVFNIRTCVESKRDSSLISRH